MTITLTTSGGLFTRLGHLIGSLNDVNAMRGGSVTSNVLGNAVLPVRVAQVVADYNQTPINSALVDGIFTQLEAMQAVLGQWPGYLQSLAINTMVQMAVQDTPLLQANLASALNLLIEQMVSGSQSVQKSVLSVGAQTMVGTPTGNPTVVLVAKRGTGLACEYALPETFTFACTRDATSGALVNQETFLATGLASVGDPLNWAWPGGSGSSLNLTVVDSTGNNQKGNLLVNSDFEAFTTANTADNWNLDTGVPGTQIFSGGSLNSYTGTNCLQFTGDVGGTKTAVTQSFGVAPTTIVNGGGTLFFPAPLTLYILNGWLKVSATPLAGVAEFALVDGTGTILNDSQGNPNSFTKALTTVTGTYTNVFGAFCTPSTLPPTTDLRIRLSTAIDSGTSVFFDHFSLAKASSFYTYGPMASVFSAKVAPLKGDSWTVALSNTMGGFQKAFQRLFSIGTLNYQGAPLQLPSSATPTISDSLIS
jgi:hypothetical protein